MSIGDESGAFGRAVEDWDRQLDEALEARDHAGLRALLRALNEEMDHELTEVEQQATAPRLDRLVEQARRLLDAHPTEHEALEHELAGERRLWAAFRERYRQAFLPPALRAYMESSALLLRPSEGGAQFAGFEKFAACGEGPAREAVTLFASPDDTGTPPNFFTAFDERSGRFTVKRAYRTGLPRGAGRACLAEHLAWLVPEPAALRELVWDNVQNSATYGLLVDKSGGRPRVRQQPAAVDELPLGRCGARLLAGLGLRVSGIRPLLDGFGFLDLVMVVEPSEAR